MAHPSTAVRTSGVGWALGIGRIGSVVGPFAGSALIANRLPALELFAVGAVPAVIAAAGALWVGLRWRTGRGKAAAVGSWSRSA